MTTLTREQARAVDRLAMQELGIPGIVLMENAGINAVSAIDRFMAGQPSAGVSGRPWPGGYGIAVQIIALKPPDQLTGAAAINAIICQKMGLDIQPVTDRSNPDSPNSSDSSPARISSFPNLAATAIEAVQLSSFPPPDLLIDALLGTGFTGDLRPDMLELIQAINATRDTAHAPKIIAIDLPSGLDCDTGQPPGNPAQDAVRADLTITFVAPKLGFSNPAAKPYLGQVIVADIGAPPGLLDRVGAI